jgi:hypothetical protein
MLWKDAFAQLSNSKVEANFADQRTYTYNGETIDTAYHLGYDLSVTKHYPVEASNSGTVAFTGDLGIYGNAVIIDHGLGLFTLYGHLSSIDVKAAIPSPSARSSARRVRRAWPPATTCISGSISMASRCCPWSGGTRSGSTKTSRPSCKEEWAGDRGGQQPVKGARKGGGKRRR